MNLSKQEIDSLAEEAAERGARRVLAELGLDNGHKAARDIRELRDVLHAWRAVKSTALHTVVRILTTLVLAALLAWAGVKLKILWAAGIRNDL